MSMRSHLRKFSLQVSKMSKKQEAARSHQLDDQCESAETRA